MTSFRDKLKDIRTTAAEQQKHRIPLTDEELGLTDGTAEHLHVRDEIANDIERVMLQFIEETPQFHINRGFFEGKYSISLSCDELCPDERGEVDKCFSRINFLLAPCLADNDFAMTNKLTVLNRDLPKSTINGLLTDEDDQQRFKSFVEDAMLRFAEEYYSARRIVPIPAAKD